MSGYFQLYYGNRTLKLTKHTTYYTISGILILIVASLPILANAYHHLFSDSYCLNGEYPRMMDRYIQYIEGSLKAVIINQDNIISWKAEQNLCSEHYEIFTRLMTLLPYASFNFIGTFDILLTSIIAELTKLLHAEFFFLFVFLTITIIGLIILKKSYEKLKRKRPKERRGFSRLIRGNVLKRQNYKCDHCRKILRAVDFHHKNGDRSDNRQRNCQALCPNCHAIETRGLLN